MKTGKKFWAALLAVVMVLGMILPAQAEEGDTPIVGISVEPVTMLEGVDTIEWNDGDKTANVYDFTCVCAPWVLAEFKDGGIVKFDWHEIQQVFGMETELVDDMWETAAWTPGEYTFRVKILGIPCEVPITIVENPVVAASAEMGVLHEGVNQVQIEIWDEEAWEHVPVLAYEIQHAESLITVELKGGETVTANISELIDLGYHVDYDLSDTVQWVAGKTYEMPVYINGVEMTMKFSVEENPVAEVEIEPITLQEGKDQCTETYEDENGNPVEHTWFHFDNQNFTVTVRYTDGTVKKATRWDCWEVFDSGVETLGNTYIGTTEWEAGGSYEWDFYFMGKTITVPVTVIADPVQSITISDITLREGIDRVEEYWGDEPVYVFDLMESDAEITVTYTDGSVVVGKIYEMYDLVGDGVGFYDQDQTISWEAGKTYTYMIKLLGRDIEAKAHVVENPIASIEAAPVELMSSQYWTSSDDEGNEFKYYSCEEELVVMITYTDGTSETLDMYELMELSHHRYQWIDDQSAENEWGPGEYTATMIVLGQEVEINITIVDNSVKTLSAKAQADLYAGLIDTMYAPYCADILITATLGNGETVICSLNEAGEQLGEVYVEFVGVSEGEVLEAGEYKLILRVDEASCETTVTVVENPIESFKIIPEADFIENVNGYLEYWMDDNGQTKTLFVYDYDTMSYQVELTLKDGTVEVYDDADELFEKYRTIYVYPYIQQEEGDIPGPGTYQVEVSLMNMIQEHTITVVSAGVKSVTVTYNGKLVEGIDGWMEGAYDENGEWFEYAVYEPDYRQFVFTVTFNDGTKKILGVYDEILGTIMGNLVSFNEQQFSQIDWKIGKNTIVLTAFGQEIPVEIELVENTYVKASISKENGLTITLEKEDGTKETYVAQSYELYGMDESYTYGRLVTDKGAMMVDIQFEKGNPRNITAMYLMQQKTNGLEDCAWLEDALTVQNRRGDMDVTVKDGQEALKEALPEDMQDFFHAWLEVERVIGDLSAKEEKLIEDTLKQYTGLESYAVLNINMYAQGRQGRVEGVEELAAPITVIVALSQELKDAGLNITGFKVLRIHNGKIQVLDAAFNKADWTVSFETDRFSNYVLAYTAPAAADPSNPSTGDNAPIVLFMMVALFSAGALVAQMVNGKKRRF